MALLQAAIAFSLSFGSPALCETISKAIDSKTGGGRDVKSSSLPACLPLFFQSTSNIVRHPLIHAVVECTSKFVLGVLLALQPVTNSTSSTSGNRCFLPEDSVI